MFYVLFFKSFREFCCSTVLSALAMHEKLLKSKLILLTIGVTRISYSKTKRVHTKMIIKKLCSIFQICVLTVKFDWEVQESAPLCNEKQIEMVILSTGIPRFNVETQTKINVEKNCAN